MWSVNFNLESFWNGGRHKWLWRLDLDSDHLNMSKVVLIMLEFWIIILFKWAHILSPLLFFITNNFKISFLPSKVILTSYAHSWYSKNRSSTYIPNNVAFFRAYLPRNPFKGLIFTIQNPFFFSKIYRLRTPQSFTIDFTV